MANLPQAVATLVAEQIRPETENKQTILGYIGLSPEVEVTVPSVDGLVAPTSIAIAFLVSCKAAEEQGPLNVEMELRGPDGILIPRSKLPTMPDLVLGRRYQCSINFSGLPIAKTGLYEMSLFDGGQLHSKHSFYADLRPSRGRL